MNLKDLLKAIKLNESTVSTVLGVLVVVVVGIFVVNYFRSLEPGNTLPTGVNTEDLDSDVISSYTVKEGDSLWTIAEQVYGTGYNWTDIQEANDIVNPSEIEAGMVLKIPNLNGEAVSHEKTPEATVATVAPEETKEPEPVSTPSVVTPDIDSPIEGDSYIVVHGDNLWNIAVRAYGDGFAWKRIAQANKLVRPQVIHAGNVFLIPRD